jgi:hypothetical protein
MNPETLGWIGGILGSLIGIAGGLYGTYCGVRNTSGRRERAFAIKAAVGCWVVVGTFVAGLFLAPAEYRPWLWLPYVLVLVLGVLWMNRAQTRIRREEAGREATP